MTRRQVLLDGFELGDYSAIAKARLRFLGADGIVRGPGLSLEVSLSDELRERLRFEIEKEIAAHIGPDTETASDGTVPSDRDEVPE